MRSSTRLCGGRAADQDSRYFNGVPAAAANGRAASMVRDTSSPPTRPRRCRPVPTVSRRLPTAGPPSCSALARCLLPLPADAAVPLGAPRLDTFLVLLIVLWLLGMIRSYTMGGFIHLLLVLAIAVVLIRVIQGRRPV